MRTKMMAALAAGVVTLGLAAGLAPSASGAPAPARKAKPYVVTLKTLPAKAQVGQRLALAGQVSGPDSARKPVVIQRRQGAGGWVTAARTRTTRRGTFSVRVPLVTGGTTSFRAVKARSTKRSQGASAVRSLAVYQWLDMVDQPAFAMGMMTVGNDIRMGGRTFPDSLASQFSTAIYMVPSSGLCTAMEASTGFLDRELPNLGTGAKQSLDMQSGPLTGPSQTAEFETGPGPVQRRVVDITGSAIAFLRFSAVAGEDASGPVTAVVGTPRVLCNAAKLPSVPDELQVGARRAFGVS
ncbi:hypothetical protein [Nocardioides lijunqiniae]|uniref:hypothetical protein n=1 Tax=Nocardioides lijunqiniae TaxID=2760832 RepID=UPI0018778C29|nr:hypothetical protein [Nocardioides lijunqiniae]